MWVLLYGKGAHEQWQRMLGRPDESAHLAPKERVAYVRLQSSSNAYNPEYPEYLEYSAYLPSTPAATRFPPSSPNLCLSLPARAYGVGAK